MFRSKALAKLQSPEKLDEPQLLIRRHNLLALGTLAAIPVITLVWGFLGAVPEEGRGQGILMSPGSVKSVQAPAAGQIVHWYVREGEVVAAGKVLGVIEQVEIEQDIRESVGRLQDIEERNRVISQLRESFSTSRKRSIETRREILTNQIQELESYIERMKALSSRTHARNLESLRLQKKNLQDSKDAAKKLAEALEGRVASYRRLNEEKLISDDQLRDLQRDHEDSKLKVQEVEMRAQEMALQDVELNEAYLNTQSLISTRENSLTNLRVQLREIDNFLAQIQKTESEQAFREESEAKETQRGIERSQKRLKVNREIRTEFAGRVLELSAREGQLLAYGQRVAQIDTRTDAEELVAIAYFKPKEGKQLAKGSTVRVTPSTVDKKKFGGVIGLVESVSDYPVTVEAVTAQVGNRSVAEQLTGGGFTIEVVVRLQKSADTPSGFAWTSETGPSVKLGAGTFSEVWATVERRTPISYVLPKIKGWSGV